MIPLVTSTVSADLPAFNLEELEHAVSIISWFSVIRLSHGYLPTLCLVRNLIKAQLYKLYRKDSCYYVWSVSTIWLWVAT